MLGQGGKQTLPAKQLAACQLGGDTDKHSKQLYIVFTLVFTLVEPQFLTLLKNIIRINHGQNQYNQ